MPPPGPPNYPLVFPANRERITQEPPLGKNPGDRTKPLDTDWSGMVRRAGGPFPHLSWPTSPKQLQDELGAG
jgi:hypothetical protein